MPETPPVRPSQYNRHPTSVGAKPEPGGEQANNETAATPLVLPASPLSVTDPPLSKHLVST